MERLPETASNHASGGSRKEEKSFGTKDAESEEAFS